MPEQKQVLELAVEAGETLLNNGAEIFRVQDTMEMIARAYGADTFHVYVLTNGIFACVDDAGGTHNAEIRHVPQIRVHLGRVTAVNALSREIVAGTISIEEAFARLEQVRQMPYKSARVRIASCSVGAACFAYLFGGTWVDASLALATGFLLQLFLLGLEKKPTGKIISNILSAALVAATSLALVQIALLCGIPCNLDKIIIGGIIPLVPGMALTNSIRDFANGDYLSGAIRLLDAVLVAGSIAIGVGFVLKAGAFLPGVAL